MLTRGAVTHPYYPAPVLRVQTPGAVRVSMVNNIPQTWAITRPSTYPMPNGAPFYVNGYPQNVVARGGQLVVSPRRPRVEMDPSNPATWQRKYVFS